MTDLTTSRNAWQHSSKNHERKTFKNCVRVVVLLSAVCVCSGCVSTVLGTAVDVTVEVVKVPFKVGAAVIDAATGDDD